MLALDREGRNWEAFEHHLKMYKDRIKLAVAEKERAEEIAASLERVRLFQLKMEKSQRVALNRRLRGDFTPRTYSSRELTLLCS